MTGLRWTVQVNYIFELCRRFIPRYISCVIQSQWPRLLSRAYTPRLRMLVLNNTRSLLQIHVPYSVLPLRKLVNRFYFHIFIPKVRSHRSSLSLEPTEESAYGQTPSRIYNPETLKKVLKFLSSHCLLQFVRIRREIRSTCISRWSWATGAVYVRPRRSMANIKTDSFRIFMVTFIMYH